MEEQQNIEGLKKELQELQVQRDEYLAGWQRARADFMNHKKEERERMQEFIKFAEEELLVELLPVVDNLELAVAHLKPTQSPRGIEVGPPQSSEAGLGGDDTLSKGFLQIAAQLKRFLRDHQVEELKLGEGKFNPEFHEAVGEIAKEGIEPGTIVEVLSKGYTLHGKLLRPAKVTIAK